MEKDKKINPKARAVAIKYSPTDMAPRVVASGKGYVADKILENATNVPVYKDSALVEELTKIDLGDNIPPELYEVVAQVLVFISDLDKLNSYKNTNNESKR